MHRDDFEDEEKKKEEEETGAANGDVGAEVPAAEADPGDEWGSFAPVGGKKKKKGKK